MNKLLYYKNKKGNIYEVKYQVWNEYCLGNTTPCLNIIIKRLNLQYYRDYVHSKLNTYNFERYSSKLGAINLLPFYSQYHLKKEYIEINDNLKFLLLSNDDLNCNLGRQIIFQKLGINYEFE